MENKEKKKTEKRKLLTCSSTESPAPFKDSMETGVAVTLEVLSLTSAFGFTILCLDLIFPSVEIPKDFHQNKISKLNLLILLNPPPSNLFLDTVWYLMGKSLYKLHFKVLLINNESWKDCVLNALEIQLKYFLKGMWTFVNHIKTNKLQHAIYTLTSWKLKIWIFT